MDQFKALKEEHEKLNEMQKQVQQQLAGAAGGADERTPPSLCPAIARMKPIYAPPHPEAAQPDRGRKAPEGGARCR